MIREVFFKIDGGKSMANNSYQNITDVDIPEITASEHNVCDPINNVTFEIKEEQLDISKEWMQTGDVKVYRDIFTSKKTFTIEIQHEDLVIEKKVLSSNTHDHNNEHTEVIRLPISEESVEFTKHKVALEDVSIYKQKIKELKSIELTLKKEESKVKFSDSLKLQD